MSYTFQFAYPWVAFGALIVVILGFLWRMLFYQSPAYIFALTSLMKNRGYASGNWRNYLLMFLRLGALGLLIIAAGRPQRADTDSRLEVEGIDIMLVLDVSGSMLYFDDLKDRRTRIRVAKDEAKNFVDNREHDQVGLVLFGGEAVARLPLTLDKEPIKEILDDLEIGLIDERSTVLFTGIATAVNRLRHSKAKSKIMILLTDGYPSPNDLSVNEANEVMSVVSQLGIKIYTVGIGNPRGGFMLVPWRPDPIQEGDPLNEELLKAIAHNTGGKYFAAQKPDDMKKIYETIDQLEKTQTETPFYTQYYELGMPFLLVALLLMLLEIILRVLIWKIL